MLAVFVATFSITLGVDIAKIFVKFDTQKKHRILVALQYVHVLSLIDLIIITLFRYNHDGVTCFCYYDVEPEYEDACMKSVRFLIDLFIGILWAIVGLIALSALIVGCIVCF